MPFYKAYGFLSKGGVARTPFLLDLLGTTPVSFHDGVNVPDADFIMGLIDPVDNGETGTGVSLWIAPRAGHDLTFLDVTIVILPTQDGQLLQGTTAPAGDRSLIVMQFQNGPLPVGSLIGQVGQITSAVYENDPPQPSAVPPLGADDRLDDEYQIEAWAAGAHATLHLIGGLATGPLHPIDGMEIQATGPYKETGTKILAIDLARVRGAPPVTAVSPTSATWFDVTAAPSGPSTETHLKVVVGVPHAAAAPATAPTATVSAAPGSVLKGRYQYTVTYVHPYGTETSVGPLSNEVNLTADGSVALAAIPIGVPPPAANPEYAVVARRIYRKGPGGGDAVLVGELPGPGAAHPPNPLPATFVDSGNGIPIGGGLTIAPGEHRAPSRLRVRYSADVPLDLSGSVTLVSAGAGSAGVDAYSGSVSAAPSG
ncbi:MAG: hypothetical protein M3Z46_10605, partial [Actinomycetota bacterium]|nr:hypothetical protein [Actinomycetota bacterium]